MGAVYLAVDTALVCEVALKQVIVPGDALTQLRDEVRLAQKVTHRNVCRTFDLEEIEGNWLVKMEYIAGQTLAQRLKQGPLPVTETVRIVGQVCAGLAAAHDQGVVHRDLKPHNVMIETASGRVVLMDFGIARAAALAGKTAENVSGTPEYMAPEQVRGREVDGRADLYSLGCVIFEMLAGERPFARATAMATALAHVNDPAPALPSSVPPRVARVVARLLEKDPARRPAGAAEVAAALATPPRRRAFWLAASVMIVATAVALVALRPARRWQPQIRALPISDENSDAPQFSPDGKLIAYHSDREQRDGIWRAYVEPLDGGPPRAVSPRELVVSRVRWQRDGKALLIKEAMQPRVYRIALDGGAPQLLAEGAGSVEDCGGRLLIGYDETPGCSHCPRLVLREAGAEREIIRFAPGAAVAYLRCDRNGRRVLYSLADVIPPVPYGAFDLWLKDLDGGPPRQLTTDRALNIGAFTPDGRSIVFCATHGGESHLWEMVLDGAAPPVQLTFSPGAEYVPDVSPDGRLLIYDVDITSSEVFKQLLAGGAARRLTSNRNILSHPQPTPDGRAIIAEAFPLSLRRAQIVSIPAEGGEPVPLVDGQTPALTSDGAEIVYHNGGHVLAMPSAGGGSRLVTEAPGEVLDLRVGPEGRVHMMISRLQDWEAWSAPLAGGAAERELPAPWSLLVPAPRGGWRAEVQILDRVSRQARCRFLAPGTALDDPSAHERVGVGGTWTADGLSWLYGRDDGVHRYWVESGEDRVISEWRAYEFAASSDGKTLYTTRGVRDVRRELITNFAERR